MDIYIYIYKIVAVAAASGVVAVGTAIAVDFASFAGLHLLMLLERT